MSKLYLYAWGNNAKRATLKGRRCRMLSSGRLGSCLVEFVDDGRREIVARRALRSAS
jgi:hypothetical protein